MSEDISGEVDTDGNELKVAFWSAVTLAAGACGVSGLMSGRTGSMVIGGIVTVGGVLAARQAWKAVSGFAAECWDLRQLLRDNHSGRPSP